MRKFFLGASAKAVQGLHNLAKHTGASLYIQPLITGRFNAVMVKDEHNAH